MASPSLQPAARTSQAFSWVVSWAASTSFKSAPSWKPAGGNHHLKLSSRWKLVQHTHEAAASADKPRPKSQQAGVPVTKSWQLQSEQQYKSMQCNPCLCLN
jgi:hypothetical protein